MKTGKVYLVGAGPGDPGLITRKGLDCLAKADVVVYDHLLDGQLLESAPPAAEKIYVGKIASEHAKEQDEINRLLVDKARGGKLVVRLKGGDPFVFGRGGEEAEVLVDNQIPFEIVPGVSSAVAAPAYAGIPVTHRAAASSFAVVTGHEDPTKQSSSIAWEKLSTGVDTLIFLMGMQNLAHIVVKLVEHGRPLDTPVAVVKDGTRPGQRTVAGSLKDIVGKVKKSGLSAPAVIVVGEVVGLREKLRWFDNRPLFGKRVLVTRARSQASALSKLLSEKGAQPVELPVIDIQPLVDNKELDDAILNVGRYDWIVFTSVNGVAAFLQRLRALKLDSRALHGRNVAAIGPATAEALQNWGITSDFCPAIYTGEGLIAGLKGQSITGQRFLLPRADIADRELTEGITRLGAEVHEVTAYTTTPAADIACNARKFIASGGVDVITFASSSTVSNLMAALGDDGKIPDSIRIACIGPKTADTATRAGLRVDMVARESTIPGLVAAIEDYFREET